MARIKINLLGGVLLVMVLSVIPISTDEATEMSQQQSCNPPECKMPDVVVVPCSENCNPVEIKPIEGSVIHVKKCKSVVTQITKICMEHLVVDECGSCNYAAYCVLSYTCHQVCASSTHVKIGIPSPGASLGSSLGSSAKQRANCKIDLSQFTCPNLVSGRLAQYDKSQSKWKKFGIPIGIGALLLVILLAVVLFCFCRQGSKKHKNKGGSDKDSDKSSGHKGHKKGSAKPSTSSSSASGHKKRHSKKK